MKRRLTTAEINHLRRLLGWVACEAGQTPEELIATAQKVAPAVGAIDDAAKARLVEAHAKAAAVPKYVHAAIKALRKAIEPDVVTVDGEIAEPQKELPAPQKLIAGANARIEPGRAP